VLRAVTLVCLGVLVGALQAPAAGAQQPVPTPPVVIDGPSSALSTPTDLAMSVARDGSGGVVYLKQSGGVQHVFASALVGGVYEPPVQVDSGAPMGSDTPVIAAGNGGLLLVAFVSGGELYAVEKPSAQAPFGSLVPLASAAASPAISISNFGKAYLAFTVADGSGNDVRTAFFDQGTWALEASPLNATAADDAGTGAGRPAVATAGDGVGVVVWGENGAIYSRRVWGTSPSVVIEQADGALPGCTEQGAGDPVVGVGGDSSYVDVAFQEQLSCGHQTSSRVLMNRLRGSAYDGLTQPDGLSPSSPDGAGDPQLTMGEYGRGFVVSQHLSDNSIYATTLLGNGASGPTAQVNSMPLVQPPDAITATAGLFSDLIAWQQDPGATGVPEIRVRYAPDGKSLGPELVLSSPGSGPPFAASGFAAAGDVAGDSTVAWVQGSGAATEILAARLYQPPGGFSAIQSFQYQRTARPTLAWSAPAEPWGPVTYTVAVDGAQAGQTTATSLTLPTPLPDGPHVWQVTAANPAAQTSTMRPATVFIDTVLPTVTVSSPVRVKLGSRVFVHVGYADRPQTGEPPADASGVTAVAINWGDGSKTEATLGLHTFGHTYRRARRYTITATATDGAGNATSAVEPLRVFKPRRKHRPKHRGKGRHG
jgi:hypothetical protein